MNPTYAEIYDTLKKTGLRIGSRYGQTYETLGDVVDYEAGEVPLRRGLNLKLGFMEACLVLAGRHDVAAIARVAPKAELGLFTSSMSYGPRLVDRLPGVVSALEQDRLTRQAFAFVGSPDDGPTADLPCTVGTQYLLRQNVLRSVVFMRSWDVTRGLPYDMIVQGMLNQAIARCLGATPGMIRTIAGSFHLYESQSEKRPTGRTARFALSDDVPRDWEGIVGWAKGYVDSGLADYPPGLLLDGLPVEKAVTA